MSYDPWRYVCPNGHSGWRTRINRENCLIYCDTCRKNGYEPMHEYMIDKKTDNKVTKRKTATNGI